MPSLFESELHPQWIEKDSWTRIANGAKSSKDIFHLPVVGLVSNNTPSTRVVVLRKVDVVKREITFHTDIRSDKVHFLQQNPNISFLFYHPEDRIQIKLSGTAVVETDSLDAEEAWLKSNTSSRKCYLAQKGSGAITDTPDDSIPSSFLGRNPNKAESEAGRKNFCMVKSCILQMEWVWLNHMGHRRIRFDYTSENLTSNWLIP